MASHVDLTMDQEAGALSGCRENPFFRLSLFLAALDSNSTLPVSPVTNLLRFCHPLFSPRTRIQGEGGANDMLSKSAG